MRKVMGSNPVQAWIFFRLLFQAHCEDQISLMFHPQLTYMIFIYSYIHINKLLYECFSNHCYLHYEKLRHNYVNLQSPPQYILPKRWQDWYVKRHWIYRRSEIFVSRSPGSINCQIIKRHRSYLGDLRWSKQRITAKPWNYLSSWSRYNFLRTNLFLNNRADQPKNIRVFVIDTKVVPGFKNTKWTLFKICQQDTNSDLCGGREHKNKIFGIKLRAVFKTANGELQNWRMAIEKWGWGTGNL